MSVDDYYRSLGVVHEIDGCNICVAVSNGLECKAHTGVLRRVWQLEYTPLALAAILILGAYVVLTSKLMNYVVGGL